MDTKVEHDNPAPRGHENEDDMASENGKRKLTGAAAAAAARRAARSTEDVKAEFEGIKETVVPPSPFAAEQANRVAAARKNAGAITVESAVQGTTTLALELQSALDDLKAKVLAARAQLDDLTAAVAAEKEEIERLHGVDVAATALHLLVAEHAEKVRVLEAEYAAKEQALAEEIANKRKEWQREQADYSYRLQTDRKREQEDRDAQRRAFERETAEQTEIRNKGWTERENAIRAREQEFTRLKGLEEAMPNMIAAEVKRAEAVLGNVLKKEYGFEKALAEKDAASKIALLESDKANLTAHVKALVQEKDALMARLAESEKRLEVIATRAIDGAAQKAALADFSMMGTRTETNGASKPRS